MGEADPGAEAQGDVRRVVQEDPRGRPGALAEAGGQGKEAGGDGGDLDDTGPESGFQKSVEQRSY